jgi:Skp family chaperone for outer membrane proteins
MIAMTARLIGLLMLTAFIATAPGTVLAGPADRRAEDAAAAARRARDTTEELRANRPAEHDRRALPGYQDDLERAEWHEEKAVRKAKDADREAGQATRKIESAGRERKNQQRREDRDKRRQREIDDEARHR